MKAFLDTINSVLSHRAARLAGALVCTFVYAYQLSEIQILMIVWKTDQAFLRSILRYTIIFSPHLAPVVILRLAIRRPR